MKDKSEVPEADIEELRQEVAVALEELDNGGGEIWDVEDMKARLLARHAKREAQN